VTDPAMPPAPDVPPPPTRTPLLDGIPPPAPTPVGGAAPPTPVGGAAPPTPVGGAAPPAPLPVGGAAPPTPLPIADGVPAPGPTPIADDALPPPPPVAAAVLPHPPLLVPELAGTAAGELDPLRAACLQALSMVLAAADSIVVVGPGPVWGMPAPGAVGSFRPYGADVRVTLPALADLDLPAQPQPDRLDVLPLSLAVAAFLLARLEPPPTRAHAATVPVSLVPGAAAAVGRALVAAAQRNASPGLATAQGRPRPVAAAPEPAAGLGAAAGDPPRSGHGAAAGGSGARGPALPAPGSTDGVGRDGRVGLVVMADLSACRTERAPGAFRAEAAEFDAVVADALRSGRPERLLALDPTEAAELLVAGLAPLQVLAGAYGAHPTPPGRADDGGSGTGVARVGQGGSRAAGRGRDHGGSGVSGRVLYEGAPYGVGYLVAVLGRP
jgi:hypothetical protein